MLKLKNDSDQQETRVALISGAMVGGFDGGTPVYNYSKLGSNPAISLKNDKLTQHIPAKHQKKRIGENAADQAT